ncbi:MAG: hypothetical protein DID91_2727704679 [Candidatus Nitrotoga sp. MKT]|nr:MAG: hypothetical protein DID91_2727704679 [Candidatus Nitrotoga sp. MKT]
MNEQPRYRRTVVASILGIVFLPPLTYIGALFATLYQIVLGFIFGIPSLLSFVPWLKDLLLLWTPNFGGGVISGAILIFATQAIFKFANHKTVSLVVASVFILSAVAGGIANVYGELQIPWVTYIAQCLGIVLGLFLPRFIRPHG